MVSDTFSRNDEDIEALVCVISIIQAYWVVEPRIECDNDQKVWTLI